MSEHKSTVAESLAYRHVRIGNVEPAIMALLKQLDALIVVLTLLGCEALYRNPVTPQFPALALLTLILSSRLFGRTETFHPPTFGQWELGRKYVRVLLGWIALVGLLLLAGFAFKVTDLFSRRVFFTWFLVTPFVLLMTTLVREKAGWLISNGVAAPRYIIIGVNDVGIELSRRLSATGFCGFFDFRSIDRLARDFEPQLIDRQKFAGHCKDVATYVRQHGIKVVYIALPLANVPRVNELVTTLRDTTASVYFVPDAFAFDLIQGRIVDLNGMPALSVCESPQQGIDAAFKRAMDLILAAISLILLSPLMLAIAVAVKLTSRGPVLFRQRRYGLYGEQIFVYKFRSMLVCEDGPTVAQATKDDPRVTPLGSFLRRTSLDELPQLLNVLRGKMSLVGPRPHAVVHNEQYRKLINGYMIRHKVRPGITGLAQVNGLRGETDTLEKMTARVHYDLEYLRTWSPWLDIKILFRTVRVVLTDRHNAY